MILWVLQREICRVWERNMSVTFFLSDGIHRDFFYPNFASSYLMNGLTDWLNFLYGNLIWPCLLMCEVSKNFSKYNHPNQPTYPNISKKCSSKSILQNFLKFCMNNHPTLGQILGKLYGDHEITLAVIAWNILFVLNIHVRACNRRVLHFNLWFKTRWAPLFQRLLAQPYLNFRHNIQ